MRVAMRAAIAGATAILTAGTSGLAAETPKRGGTLVYMIPSDAPPSLDGHRETTYATIHTAAPFYSVLMRINPDNPSSTNDFVCDLCTEMPKPTDDGKTWTFKIRDGVKFPDGSPLTAADVGATWQAIIFPAQGTLSPRSANFMMVDKVEAPDASCRLQTQISDQRVSAGACRPLWLDLREEDPR
jgi:peptide/nickel transport system substrate-binding protein